MVVKKHVAKRNIETKGNREANHVIAGGGGLHNLSSLEDSVRRQSKKTRTETAILGTLAVVGFVGLALMAPNAVQLLRHVMPDMRPTSQRQSVKRAIGRLIQKGYIRKAASRYEITEEGSIRLSTLLSTGQARMIKGRNAETAVQWDGKWRIVIFDIKESKKHVRDELRSILVSAGFVKLQASVWVYPFRCDEVIALLKFHLHLGWDLVYIIADAIEGDEWLREIFTLPPAHL